MKATAAECLLCSRLAVWSIEKNLWNEEAERPVASSFRAAPADSPGPWGTGGGAGLVAKASGGVDPEAGSSLYSQDLEPAWLGDFQGRWGPRGRAAGGSGRGGACSGQGQERSGREAGVGAGAKKGGVGGQGQGCSAAGQGCGSPRVLRWPSGGLQQAVPGPSS